MVDGQLLSERRSRKLVSYTRQEVTLWQCLTVEESLRYAAEFKLGHCTHEQKQTKVLELLDILGLQRCADTLTADISGGQAKRLSIGLELVSDPKVMLLDEPTSGLDSVAAYQVLAYVRELAARGRVIACVIHQPNSQQMQLIDDLFVLAKGRRIYNGPTSVMVTRFASFELFCPVSYNPADYALEVASLEQEDERLKRLMMEEEKDIFDYKPTRLATEKSVDESYQRYSLTTFQQLQLLLHRTAMCVVKDSYQFKARIGINIAIASLLSLAFYSTGNNADRIWANTAVLIISLYAIFFTSLFSAVLVYPRESACLVQESKNNWYSLKAYYWAKIIVELPTLFCSSLVFVVIVYFFTSQPLEWFRFGMFTLVCLLFGWISQMLGLLLGSLMPIQNSVFIGILVLVPASLFSGFFVLLRDAGPFLRPLMYVSFVRYAFEGALHAIYGYDRPNLECPEVFCYFGKLKHFLSFISMPELAYGKTNVTGQLIVDGQLLSERRSRKLVSYTRQEVTLWQCLTVEESLRYAAEFKLGHCTHEQKQTKVLELLDILGLQGCADTLTADISGGQAKRLSIGLELVSDPKVMLLDEPTSGLDSVAAYQVLAYVFMTSVFIVIVYYFTSQPLEWFRFGMFTLVCLMFSWVAQLLGLILGSLMPAQQAIFCCTMVLIPACLGSGFFVPLRDAGLVVQPLMYVSFVRYAFEGAISAIYGYDRPNLDCPEIFCYFRKLQHYLDFISMPQLAYGYDLLALFVWIVVLMLALYLSLRRRVKQD
uniref:Uncharacterized protein n=1 Tax=Anopheles atroparvus TaxID=41427 RepID=A0A182IJD2_ANOAO